MNSIKFLCGAGLENVDIVDLDSAKHLKICGFNEATHWYWLDKDISYVKSGLKRVKMNARRVNSNKFSDFMYSAPTRKQVIKWIKRNPQYLITLEN